MAPLAVAAQAVVVRVAVVLVAAMVGSSGVAVAGRRMLVACTRAALCHCPSLAGVR